MIVAVVMDGIKFLRKFPITGTFQLLQTDLKHHMGLVKDVQTTVCC